MDDEQFSSWFRDRLLQREWSQRDFSRRSGISPSTISEWWRGTRVPDPASCEKIADVLHVDPDLVLVLAGHRPNVEELAPDDPRTDLIALVRRVQWDAEREALIRAQLEIMVKQGKRKG